MVDRTVSPGVSKVLSDETMKRFFICLVLEEMQPEDLS